MHRQLSQIKTRISGAKIKPWEMKTVTDSAVQALANIGIIFDRETVSQQIQALQKSNDFNSIAMDNAFVAPATTPSIPTPIQFLQTWLPGFVKVVTAARKIDELIGIYTIGSWEDEEIVQGIVEPSAMAIEYGDLTNIPLASWNTNFERRTIVRGEMGMAVGVLEEGRAAAMRLNSADTKRQAAAVSLEIFRNAVGFYGWNSGKGRTFGILNDPSMMPYYTNATGKRWSDASGGQDTQWDNIIADIRAAIVLLRTQSQDNIDPLKQKMVLGLPTNKVDYLSITSKFGITVKDWLLDTYKNLRIVSAPEFQGAGPNAGSAGEPVNTPIFQNSDSSDVFYLFAEDIDSSVDGSTDDGTVLSQLVVTKFITLGVEKRSKSYVEDYSSATAGALCKRPWAVVRVVGI